MSARWYAQSTKLSICVQYKLIVQLTQLDDVGHNVVFLEEFMPSVSICKDVIDAASVT